MLPSSAGAEIGPEENSEAAGPIFKKLAFGGLTNDRTFAKRTEPSRVLFFAREVRLVGCGAFGRDEYESELCFGKAVSSHRTP